MAGQYFGGLNSIYILWSNQLGNQSNQSHEKYSWNFYSRLDLSLWIIFFFCSCILGEGLDEGMDILHEMILSNRRRRRQNASNHIGPPKPQRRKVRRSQSTYHWRSTLGSKVSWSHTWTLIISRSKRWPVELPKALSKCIKSHRAWETSKKKSSPLLEPSPLTVHSGAKFFVLQSW